MESPSPSFTFPPSPTATRQSSQTPRPTVTLWPSPTLTPSATPTPVPAVLIGAGDIAYCGKDYQGDDETAKVLSRLVQAYPQAALFTAGDNVQGEGLGWEYRDCFGPTWGQFKERIHPAPGNHDYLTAGAAPYFSYFGAAAGKPGQGYYSYELGSWHIAALNSNCNDVACGANSSQVKWLRADLAQHVGECILLYWHHPRWSSGLSGSNPAASAFWQAAVDFKAAIVVSGHDHDYERFAPMDTQGNFNPSGVREFVVGTGGAQERAWGEKILPQSQARNNTDRGVILFGLYPGRYTWEYFQVAGGTFHDMGAGTCPK